jgi:hypothetical protein
MADYENQGMHIEEFQAEEPVVLERRNRDLDGYVGKDGKPEPHETPSEVARHKDAQAELDAHLMDIPEREGTPPLDEI